jgi:V8-like Glu-specific endopeptidase
MLVALLITVAPNIFGRDRRIPTPPGKPWSAVGLIEGFAQNSGDHAVPCSAFLVGRNWILSAGHCFLDRAFRPLEIITFCGGEHGTGPCSDVVWGENAFRRTREHSKDWVLGRLKEPLGDQLGWFPLPPQGQARIEGLKAAAVGFPSYPHPTANHIRLMDSRCSIRSVGPLIATDCAFSKGESGGALLYFDKSGNPHIGGILMGSRVPLGSPEEAEFPEYDPKYPNVAVPIAVVVDAVIRHPEWGLAVGGDR